MHKRKYRSPIAAKASRLLRALRKLDRLERNGGSFHIDGARIIKEALRP